LALETDWSFRDSLVPGWPESRVRGKGEVDLAAAGGLRFRAFAVEAASLDLRTVARLVPAVRLNGTLYAAGTLNGPLRDVHFAGTLAQRDGALPVSTVKGTVLFRPPAPSAWWWGSPRWRALMWTPGRRASGSRTGACTWIRCAWRSRG